MKNFILILLASFMTGQAYSQTQKDVTVETYGIFGKGRPNDPGSYYFLQSEGNDLAKIKTSNKNTGKPINIEREGDYVFFKLDGTNKYLKFTPTNKNQVKWLDGKDKNAKWKEISPIQPNAGKGWKSYVLAENTSLFLRHAGFVMYAHPRQNHPVFYGDATWKIEGGMLTPDRVTHREAYGKKKMQTYAVVNKATNNFFAGTAPNGQLKIIDVSNRGSGKLLELEIRYKSTQKAAVLVDGNTGKYITADAKGNISLTEEEQQGSIWEVTSPLQSGLDKSWFSLKSKHPRLRDHYLRHTGYVLFAHKAGTVAAQFFKGDASWKFIDRK